MGAQEPPLEEQLTAEELPEDNREAWRVEIVGIRTDPSDRELVGVATGIPRVLVDALEPVETHQLSLAERHAIARGLLEEQLREALRRRNELQNELDGLPFSEEGEFARREEERALLQDIREIEDRIARIRGTEEDRIEVDHEKPVEIFLPEEPEFTAIHDPRKRAEERESDLLLFGELQRSDNYLFFTLYEYSYHLDRERELATTASLAEELPENMGQLEGAVQRLVAGRPVAPLSVRITGYEPERAEVFVNDESRGFGSVRVPLLPLGNATLRIEHPAIPPLERSVRIQGDQSNEVDIEIPDPETGYVAVVSDPPGASIYIDSLWQGVTPYLVRRPPEERQVRLSLEEYYDSQFLVGPETPNLVSRELLPASLEWETVVENKRDRFYRSFGWFILSLPAPIILNGIYGNLSTLFPEGQARSELSQGEADRRLNQSNTVFYSYYATLGVSVALFGNMMYRLIDYIRTGEGYHDR
ncbi:MAG: PEGA domain-containing protein [Spirochaetaceae bacterium]